MPRWVFTVFGVVTGSLGTYTLVLIVRAAIDFAHLLALNPQNRATRLAALMLMGSIDILTIVIFGIFTALLFALAAWGLEPRRRWREWRTPNEGSQS
ncbi:MAG TPA: hypothetical protein VGD02_00325 [Gemmatimonadaceae bacterium]